MERKSEQLRNIGLVGHVGCGKTSLAEAMLLNGKATSRLGKVDDGSSNFDFEPEEIKRKITLSTAFHHCTWKKHIVNLIDTPGDDNFLTDTKFSLKAADGAVVVVDATAGVKVGTEKVWGFADDENLPRMIFINRMDRERADFDGVVEQINESFEKNATPVFLPIGAEEDFRGVVDLIRMKAYVYEKDGSGNVTEEPPPGDMADAIEELREKVVENIVEANDELMEKYLEGEEISPQEIEETFIQGIRNGSIIPILCGSAVLNMGVDQVLNLITQAMPSPLDRGPFKGMKPGTDEEIEREASPDAPFSGIVFKTVADPFAGKLTVLRILSGTLTQGSTLYNPNKETKEKFGSILLLEGKKQKPAEEAATGDIVAFAKLKETATGDTLCDEKNPIVYPSLEPLPSVLSYAVEAKEQGTEDKLFSSLTRVREEDPTLRLDRGTASEIILSGTGQIHLEATIEKLQRKFGVGVELKPVRVPYLETIKKAVQGIVYRHKKQTGGRGQFAEVHFDVAPLERSSGFEFEEALVGMNVPRNFVPAVEKGIQETLSSGVVAGYPVVDVKVRFYDGKSHDVDSSEMAFKIAASMCFKKGVQDANPVLLEPVMKLDIVVPEESMGDVMGDLTGRRGRVLGMEGQGKYQVIKAQAPMAEVTRYALDLNQMSGGRGSFTMELSHYEELPSQLAEKVIAEAREEE
jgi:elongation factor G